MYIVKRANKKMYWHGYLQSNIGIDIRSLLSENKINIILKPILCTKCK